jgi:hypothetical protein
VPLTGLTFFEVLWTLPAAVAYQFQLIYLQIQGREIIAEYPGEEAMILERLKKARRQRG